MPSTLLYRWYFVALCFLPVIVAAATSFTVPVLTDVILRDVGLSKFGTVFNF